MAWCPNCKNEYIEGIKICPKCDIELVDKDTAFKVEKIRIEDTLYNTENVPDDVPGEFNSEAFTAALDAAFGYDEADSISTDAATDEEKDIISNLKELNMKMMIKERENRAKNLYQDKREKAEDVKGSAFSLIIVGVIGIVFIVLFFAGVIPIPLTDFSKYVTSSVMCIIFVGLIIGGIVSLKSVKNLNKLAAEEEDMQKEIERWYKSNLTADYIDDNLFDDSHDEPEESKYFLRIVKIKKILKDKYMNLDEGFEDHICEKIYNFLYDEI